jgi:hypothetical protein
VRKRQIGQTSFAELLLRLLVRRRRQCLFDSIDREFTQSIGTIRLKGKNLLRVTQNILRSMRTLAFKQKNRKQKTTCRQIRSHRNQR